jgi:UPF0755 protein
MIALASAGATVAAALLIVAVWALWSYRGPGPEARSGEYTTVVLRKGSSLPEIASALERGGVIKSSAIFMTAAQVTGAARELKAGEYRFASRASMARILDDVRQGRVLRRQITIPEGLTSQMAAEIIAKTEGLEGEAPAPPEGAILPDTYQYQLGDDRAAVLKRMMDARDEVLAALWAQRQPGLPITTPEEAMVLASIVEKETALPDERPKIAAVFINRLRAGMRLESDPTIIYGVTGGRPLGRKILLSEKTAATPYNTYVIAGLPPTPIANPGRAAIAAVLDPPKTDDLFFVADGTGGHVFAPTYEQHLKNVERWRAVRREREAAEAAPAKAAP